MSASPSSSRRYGPFSRSDRRRCSHASVAGSAAPSEYRPRVTSGGLRFAVWWSPEEGLLFEVNFTDYLDVGLFLDHRLVRRRIRERAEGCGSLNLFAYTCAATAHAAAGGASRTVSVDTSHSYLEWGKRNLGLNGIGGPAHEIVRSDGLTFLRLSGQGPVTTSC
ncbi:MAG: class I SAM-dependent methyltransferase [Halomonas sp.]|uniref:class I SAM-dependent methyltransferase n=1 Tax=Halomonas sp. TaxID=1486246 RepID=UPI002ACEDF19|nr:class I SAM-dependent methyltransferase [Halomonas sp.]MDZ7852637.1 class I SAM-dependent methyltransferase [Halomonas sp.]